MSFLLDLLRRVGLEGGAVAAATCLLFAFYAWRAKSIGSRAASMGAAAVAYSVVIAVVLAFGLALGWFDPNVGIMLEHLRIAATEFVERATGPGRRLFRWVLDALTNTA